MTFEGEVQWLVDNKLDASHCGHGLCFYAGQPCDESRIVAFVDGFGWLHADEDATVRYRPELAREPKFSALRAGIESLIRSKKIPQEMVIEEYWCGING